MSQYRKKPVVIEAFRLGHDNMPDWFCDAKSRNDVTTHNQDGRFRGGPDYALIKTLEGEMRAEFGDWIIRGVKGELYPCKPDIFAATYEPADSAQDVARVPLTDEQRIAIQECIDYLTPAAKDFSDLGLPGMGDSKHARCIRMLRSILAPAAPAVAPAPGVPLRDIHLLADYAEGSKSPAMVNAFRRVKAWLNAAPAQAEQQDTNPPFANCSFRICDLPGQCRGEGKCHHPRGKYKQQANCTCGGGSGHTRSCPEFDESMMRYEPFGKAAEQQGDGGADPRILAGRWRSDFVNKCGHPPDAEDGYAAGYRDAQPSARVSLSDEAKQRVYDAVRDALGDAYDCTRVWHAWGVGTMSQDDFRLVAEDDERVAEIADAAILAASAAQGGKS